MEFEKFKALYEKIPVEEYPNRVTPDPLVSVCVQTYQHVDYIHDCLEGILAQETDFNYEILLGEDDSTDGTREICKAYAGKFPDKIKLILHNRENNIKIGGKPTGRFNFMYNLLAARGAYVALCEGDDYWSDTRKLQKQVQYLQINPRFSMCSHDVELIFKGVKEHKIFNESLEVAEFGDMLTQGLFVPTPSMVYRNDALPGLPEWFAELWVGDFPLTLLLTTHGKNYHFGEIMAVKQKNPGGITQHADYVKSKEFIDRSKWFFYKKLNEYTSCRYNNLIQPRVVALSFRILKYELKAADVTGSLMVMPDIIKHPIQSLKHIKKRYSADTEIEAHPV